MSVFTTRVAQLLEATGVPLNTVITDGISIEPHEEGFLLKWQGAAVLTPQQVAALVADAEDPEPDGALLAPTDSPARPIAAALS